VHAHREPPVSSLAGDEYVFEYLAIIKKRPTDLSIVKRLGGFSWYKGI